MFKVQVVGEYVARSGVMDKEKIKKPYEIEGNIPTLDCALSIVKNKLLGPKLTQKYPDYVTYLTYHIVKITPLDEESRGKLSRAEVQFMDRPTLVKYVKDNNIGVTVMKIGTGDKAQEITTPMLDVRYYPNLFRLREAVQLAKEDPAGYYKQFQLREPDLRMDLEMAKCNPDLFPSDETKGFVASASTPSTGKLPKARKAAAPKAHVKHIEDRLQGLTAEQMRDGDMGPMDEDSEVEVGDL